MSGSAFAPASDTRSGRVALPEGGALVYEERGAGPALVFLHSWAADRVMWRPTIARVRSAA